MRYEISFKALNTKGEVVGTRTFCISSTERLDVKGKTASLLRLCVEYARLTGLRCSLAEITDLDERLSGTAHAEGVEDVKSEEPKPTAKWEKYGYKWRCSACKSKINIDGTPEDNGLHFCPKCGANMQDVDEKGIGPSLQRLQSDLEDCRAEVRAFKSEAKNILNRTSRDTAQGLARYQRFESKWTFLNYAQETITEAIGYIGTADDY